MSKKIHGRRYSFAEKKEILTYLSDHTYKETCEKFRISETTLSRWKKMIKSGGKINRSKIIISLPNFWLDYLNEQIELDVWEDYSEAILNTIRYYFRSQKSIQEVDSKYLESAKEILPSLVDLNPNVESMLISSFNEVIAKTHEWKSTEGIPNLIENWIKASTGKLKEFEFQNEIYHIRDISVKHLVGVKKSQKSSYLLGLKRKLTETDIYILAIAKEIEDSSLLLAMDTLKRAAMGSLPPISEAKYRSDLIDKIKKAYQNQDRDRNIIQYQERVAEWKQNHQELIRQQKKSLVDIAKQVNLPLKPSEKEILNALEKQIGKKIKRITSSYEEPQNVFGLGLAFPIHENIIIPPVDEDFPTRKFPYHYIAFNGAIILISLFNLGLTKFPSEILKLKRLSYLCLNSNKIIELPKQFSNLKYLETIYMDNNQFTQVPEIITELPNLHFLSMQNNMISQIPVALTQTHGLDTDFPSHTQLNFSGNQIENSSLSKEQQELEKNLILII